MHLRLPSLLAITFTMASQTLNSIASNSSQEVVLLGSYTNYIHSLIFTPPTSPSAKDGKLEVGPDHKVGPSHSWVTQHPSISTLFYAVSEDETNGTVSVLELTDNGKNLNVLKEVSSGGGAPAHCVVVADGKALAVANYMGGSVSLLPLAENGLFTNNGSDITTVELPFRNGSSPLRVASRQDGSHPHEVVEVKANGSSEVWVPDLGSDVVWRLQLEENSSPITWKLKVGEELKGDEGGGPRHIIVSEDAKNLYILNELLPALVHYQVPSSSNSSVPILKSKTSVVPPPSGIPNPLYIASRPLGAELLSIPSAIGGPILVASTRTLADRANDALAIFKIKENGEVELQEFLTPRNGREFRGVGLSRDGKYILAVGQTDGYVSVWGQDEGGKWDEMVQQNVTLTKTTGVLFSGIHYEA